MCGGPWARFSVDGPPLCETCQQRLESGELVWPSYTARPVPPEDRFDDLFEAAHVLLAEQVDNPDQIIPTLAFAHELGRGLFHLPAEKKQMEYFADSPEAWDRTADRFARTYGARPVRLAEGVLILERIPISVRINREQDTGVATEVLVRVLPHLRPARPEEVGRAYANNLRSEGIAHDGTTDEQHSA